VRERRRRENDSDTKWFGNKQTPHHICECELVWRAMFISGSKFVLSLEEYCAGMEQESVLLSSEGTFFHCSSGKDISYVQE
jgi:hypothetical protein